MVSYCSNEAPSAAERPTRHYCVQETWFMCCLVGRPTVRQVPALNLQHTRRQTVHQLEPMLFISALLSSSSSSSSKLCQGDYTTHIRRLQRTCRPLICCTWPADRVHSRPTLKLKLKLKTNLYSAIKSEDSEALDGGTSQLNSQREYGKIRMF